MGEIQIELQDTINKANKLQEIGGGIQRLSAQDFAGIEAAVMSAWKGDAAEYFHKKFDKYNTILENHGKEINRIADDLHGTVKRLQQAETFGKSLWG
ncbi:MAG: WXG100 family type VII secretion target [Lachnospiraceae bacterium]|nr:WXG100 family type VII secretion target [Lachnospiraceae bacterium]